jgi:hypothetical protein
MSWKVAIQLLVRATRPVGECLDEEIPADEGSLPRGAESSEHLLPVTSTPGLVDADLEGLQLLGHLGSDIGVIGGDAGDQRPVRGVHGGEELGLRVDDHDRVQWSERLGVVERPRGRRLEHGGGSDVGRCVLHVEEPTVADGPL